MRKRTLYILGFAVIFLLGGYYVWRYYLPSETEKSEQKVVETAKTTRYPFVLNDPNSDFSFSSDDNFNFDVSGDEILRPVSRDVNVGVAELQLHISANDERMINISGLCSSAEKNTTAFSNLGLARANSVKNYLILNGIPSSRINVIGKITDDLKSDGKIYYGPVTFGISMGANNSGEKKN